MNNQNSSTTATTIEPTATEPLRRNVDIGIHLVEIERAGVEDTLANKRLLTIPDYTRDIIQQFLYIREYCRQNDLPLWRPVDIADAIISGDITINPLKK